MAQGDVVKGLTSVTASGHLDIQPPSGSEWVIHNIKYSGQVSFNDTDGTNVLNWGTDTSSGGQMGASFHATNDYYLRIINTGSVSILVSYDGVQTK